jgi:hypothetical protein
MHCAEDPNDADFLVEVEALAQEQIDWIDTHEPTHRLAMASSGAPGMHTLWEMLAREAHGRRETTELRRAKLTF